MSTVATLLTKARALAQINDPAAEAAFARVLALDPASVDAHVGLADIAAARGAHAIALAHRQQACRLRPTDADLLVALGVTSLRCGFVDEAAMAWQFAAQVAPSHSLAHLQLGQLYEQQGRADDATRSYFRAITSAQLEGQWLDAATIPPALADVIAHAMANVHAGRVRILAALIDPLVERFGPDAMQRVRRCLMGYLQTEPVAPADARQQPRFLYFPGLDDRPYLPRDGFPWFDALEAATDSIRAEALQALSTPGAATPFLQFGSDDRIEDYLAGSNAPPRWDAVFFYRHGEHYPQTAARCPATAAALETLPLLRIPGHAPEVCFSVLAPGTHILPHHGVTNIRSVVHLPLVVPSGCALTVGGERHAWQEGQCVAFDDTWLHEAINPSDKTRVILLMDAWNPGLREEERLAVTALIEGIGEFSRG